VLLTQVPKIPKALRLAVQRVLPAAAVKSLFFSATLF
jgi:hypothetical protein